MVDIETTELAAWLRLTLTPGLGGESQRKLLQSFGLPEAILASGQAALSRVIGPERAQRLLAEDAPRQAAIEKALAWAVEANNHIVSLADPSYPQALLSIADPPALLYLKGRIDLLQNPALAMVGSRHATPQGVANAEAFAQAFAAVGLTIVSGLALGIDAAAHRGALRAGDVAEMAGSTIAVIGTGADRIYPAKNRDLARQIAEQGLIVSEFPLDTPAMVANFPRRNRIIAGLAKGCLVVEAAARSGSQITARLASEAGREVFAIPGSIHSPLSKGCHQLIKQGAKLVESAQDVLEELNYCPKTRVLMHASIETTACSINTLEAPSLEAPQEAVVLQALGHDPCTIDSLVARSGLSSEQLLAVLLQLELAGKVASLPGSRYQRCG